MNRFICCFIFAIILSNFSIAQSPVWEWAKGAGGTKNDIISSIATDNLGNFIIVGFFSSSSLTLGNITLQSNNGFGYSFIAKFNNDGDVIWVKTLANTLNFGIYKAACDADGNIFATGSFYGPSLSIGPFTLYNPSTYFHDIYLVKLNPNGDVIWAKAAGGNRDDIVNDLAVDQEGNLIITGSFESSTFIIDTATVNNLSSNYPVDYKDMFLAKYDSQGNFKWVRSAGGKRDDVGYNVTTDKKNNIIITGQYFSDSLAIDSLILIKADINQLSSDMFYAKYSGNGHLVFVRRAGGLKDDYCADVETDSEDNIILTGSYGSSSISFDNITFAKTKIYVDYFLVKLDSSGYATWGRKAVHEWDVGGNCLTVDSDDNISVAGSFSSGTISFGSVTISTPFNGYPDLFVVRYDKNGNDQWATHYGCETFDHQVGMAIDTHNDNIVIGNFNDSPVTFGNIVIPNAGSNDFYMAKLSTAVGLPENPQEDVTFLVYPNPAKEAVILRTPVNTKVEMLNIDGYTIQTFTTKKMETTIDIGSLQIGVYMIRMQTNNTVILKKFIKL